MSNSIQEFESIPEADVCENGNPVHGCGVKLRTPAPGTAWVDGPNGRAELHPVQDAPSAAELDRLLGWEEPEGVQRIDFDIRMAEDSEELRKAFAWVALSRDLTAYGNRAAVMCHLMGLTEGRTLKQLAAERGTSPANLSALLREAQDELCGGRAHGGFCRTATQRANIAASKTASKRKAAL